ncbi:hypothetical protein [Herbiconiux daphne]|uniref:Uncharacterized protein n=1 Tax=Herbiconiux daphne TaxID=2970914 RepID=A0ABT2H962_9MICO|nr:hypothetical protein [Herbiconiux daphne]MCS5736434.1 hypothetical protein [Herbiconiux daphne]
MGQDGEKALIGILWVLLKELARLEAFACSAAQYMKELGLDDEASTLWDLCTVARDWVEEVMDWVMNLAQGKGGNDE